MIRKRKACGHWEFNHTEKKKIELDDEDKMSQSTRVKRHIWKAEVLLHKYVNTIMHLKIANFLKNMFSLIIEY